jgi:hypothetical protein
MCSFFFSGGGTQFSLAFGSFWLVIRPLYICCPYKFILPLLFAIIVGLPSCVHFLPDEQRSRCVAFVGLENEQKKLSSLFIKIDLVPIIDFGYAWEEARSSTNSQICMSTESQHPGKFRHEFHVQFLEEMRKEGMPGCLGIEAYGTLR